eukprot:2589474-Pleurochrysis_carterae.AAC.1
MKGRRKIQDMRSEGLQRREVTSRLLAMFQNWTFRPFSQSCGEPATRLNTGARLAGSSVSNSCRDTRLDTQLTELAAWEGAHAAPQAPPEGQRAVATRVREGGVLPGGS